MRIEKVSKLTPKGPGSSAIASENVGLEWRNGGGFNWQALIACVLHPAKVAVIEALMWIDRPLSATQLEELFDGSSLYLGIITYHLKSLEAMGVLGIARSEAVRGATEKFYFFLDKDAGADAPEPTAPSSPS
jgi:hypothetical protein